MSLLRSLLAGRFGHVAAHQTFVVAALVAAHATCGESGFGAADVRFLFLLFTNWVEHDVLHPQLELDLTQVRRVLERLVEERHAERIRRGARPRHRLTDEGLLRLSEELVDPSAAMSHRPVEESLFVICFASLYRPILARRVRLDERPANLRRRLARRLDPRRALDVARRRTRALLADLGERCAAGSAMQRALEEGEDEPEDVRIAALERLGSYQLERVRPVAEVVEALPPDVRDVELRRGPGTRVRLLFGPMAELVRAELAVLDAIEAELADASA